MELIDLIEPCAAKSCEVIELQGTERNGTFELVAPVYRVVFCGECSKVNGRKVSHGVGLVIEEDIVLNNDKDGIAIECINARVSIKSGFVTFVVAYALTE